MDDICDLPDKFYPLNFSEQAKINLKFELYRLILEVVRED